MRRRNGSRRGRLRLRRRLRAGLRPHQGRTRRRRRGVGQRHFDAATGQFRLRDRRALHHGRTLGRTATASTPTTPPPRSIWRPSWPRNSAAGGDLLSDLDGDLDEATSPEHLDTRPHAPRGVRRARDHGRREGDRRQPHPRNSRRVLLERQTVRGTRPLHPRRARRVRVRHRTRRDTRPRPRRGVHRHFRSKVIYNVDRLGPGGKGYVEREERGKSHRTRLSRIGELWVRSHADGDTATEE